MVGTAQFVALNGFTALAALALASRCRVSSAAERLLAVTVLFVGVALVSGLALGVTGHLRFWPLLATQAFVAMVAAWMARWEAVAAMKPALHPSRIVVGAAQRGAALLLVVAYLFVAFIAIVSEPDAGDALMYHLPLVAAYARDGAITVPALGAFWNTDLWAYYPGTAYVLSQWWVLPFGSGVLVDLVQLPAAAATALATFVLARRLGVSREAAMWSAMLFLAMPIVINQCATPLVDVTVAFLFTAGLAFLWTVEVETSQLVLAGIAWGAAPGTKLATLFYLLPGALCVGLYWARGGDQPATRRLLRALAMITVATLALSSYWYARNYWLTGSPIFPVNLRGANPKVWSNILFYGPLLPLLDFTMYDPMFFYNYETGAGVQFVALAIPATFALAARGWRRRHLGVTCLALLPLGMLAFWVVHVSTELHTLFRYVLPVVPIGFAAVGWLMDHAPRRRVQVALAAGSVAFSVVNAVPHVGTFILPASLSTGLASWMLGTGRLGRFDRMGDLAIQDYRRAWAYLDQLAGSHHIAASHLIFSYPMLGADFRHDLHFLEARSREQWLTDLQAANVDHVALAAIADAPDAVAFGAGEVQLHLRVRPTSNESVGVMHVVPASPVRGLRIRYTPPASPNARVVVGLNRFTRIVELPTDLSGTPLEQVIEWRGELHSIEVSLRFDRRTGLYDDLLLQVASIELLLDSDTTVRVPLDPALWARVSWPIEYYWMADDPQHFRLAFRDHDYWSPADSNEMHIYEVVHRPEAGAAGGGDR